jgi:riboflavin biosynthesis pyrimidine reductase
MRQATVRSSIEARLEHLFGAAIDWHRATGVVHVAAIDARARAVLAVGPGAPASPTDRFVLGFARARADAIVTSGAILRAEPDLVHRSADDPEEERAWQGWRRAVLGRSEPPCVLVLSESGRIPPAHPALAGPGRRILWTRAQDPSKSEDGARTGTGARSRTLEVRIDPGSGAAGGAGAAASLARAIAWLRAEVGTATIAIEAGPAATLGLYRAGADPASERVDSSSIDELLLALFAGDGAKRVAGEAFPSAARLAAFFAGTPGRAASAASASDQPRSRVRIEEPSGPWIFERYRRAGGGGD